MNNDKFDDQDSLAQTLRPPAPLSQRPTLPTTVIKLDNINVTKQYPPMKYKFHLIGIIIIVIIITAIICITKPLQSYSMPERVIFNLPPIVIPNDSAQIKPIEVTPVVPDINTQTKTLELKQYPIKPNIKQIPVKENKIKEKDYGINDLINPYDQEIIYKL